jgi:transcription antitermination factor NusG
MDCVIAASPSASELLLPRLVFVRIECGHENPPIDVLAHTPEVLGIVRRGTVPVSVDDEFIVALAQATDCTVAHPRARRAGSESGDIELVRALDTALRSDCASTRRGRVLEIAGEYSALPSRLRLRAS